MNSSSRLLFCEETMLKSCSSIFSENSVDEHVDWNSHMSNEILETPFTPQHEGYKGKGQWLTGNHKKSVPFTPANETSLNHSNIFQAFQKSQPQKFLTPQPKLSNLRFPIGVIQGRAEKPEELTIFDIDVGRISEDGRTSLMIKNIPNKYTKEMITEIIDLSFYERYDFFYLPLDFKVLLL